MDRNQTNKARVLAYWHAIDSASVDTLGSVAAAHLPNTFCYKGPAPIGELEGPIALVEQVLAPLKRAIPDLQRYTHLFMGGQSIDHINDRTKDAYWVGGTGYFTGVAINAFLGIPATDTKLRIRWSEFIRFEDEKMVESQVILDFVDWFEQIGLPVLPVLPASRGISHVFPAATDFDGVFNAVQDQTETEATIRLGDDFIYGGLNGFNEKRLASMGMAKFFHPNLKWYGPGGIGACFSFTEFEEFHQKPWLIAFPDRKVVGLESLFSEGRLLACSGVACVEATHTGPYLGEQPTGASLKVSGIDFWLRSGERFTENWVFVDMIDLFKQMGIDLFARMLALRDDKKPVNVG